MTPEQWEKLSEIFHEASELEGDERTRYLDSQCDGNDTLRREVESLLKANREAGNFISEPVAGAFATRLLKGPAFGAGEMLDHYRIISKIGSGGMGEVYLAEDTKLDRKVAIKTLSPTFCDDENFLKRFRNEARAAANLNHPNVATVYSVDEHNGAPFIALEYIDGKTLNALVPPGGIDLETCAAWFVPVSAALAKAHSSGIIHRDIKPGNIMLTADGTVKILDFGLACFNPSSHLSSDSETDLTHAGQILGTPAYMSPEQARGEDVDHRSDIFSLGVVMYEAITGTKPFDGDSNAEIVSNLLKTDPPPIEKLRPEFPPLLAGLVEHCLEKRPRDRPQNMEEIRSVLDNFGTRASVQSLSNRGLSQRFYRQVRSGRVWPNIIGAAIVLVIALAGWFYFSWSEGPPAFDLSTLTIRRLSQSNDVVFAAITPDGRSIVYNAIQENGNRELWIRRVDDRNALRLVESQPVQYWGGITANADASQIYYVTADRATLQSTMYRISALGGRPRKLADGVNDLGSLSSDGKRILFIRYLDRMRILSANSEDGSDERVIREEDPENRIFRDPHYSADGRFIYYSRMDRIDGVEWWKLVRIPAEGGEETVIIPRRKEKINEIAVLSDGSGLLLNGTDPTSNLSQLYFVSIPDGELTRLTHDLNFYFGISVDKSGRSIVAAQRYTEQRIWVGETDDPGQARAISPEPNVFRLAEWTPDGRIVYDAIDTVPHIWIMDADGKNRQQLTPNDSGDKHPRVSNDGQFIVFTSDRSGREQVWRMNVDGSNQVLLADVEGVTNAPRVAPDGETVYFSWVRGNRSAMGRVPIAGGEVSELERFSESEWAVSPDGSRIAYSIRDAVTGRNKLAILRMDSPTPDIVLDASPIYLLEWRPDSQAVYVRERDEGENPFGTIIEYDIVTGIQRVFLSTAPEYVLDLSFSRDGKQMAVIRGRLLTDAIMLAFAGSDSNKK